MYSKSKNKDCAGALLKSMATVENGTKWYGEVVAADRPENRSAKIKSAA